MPSSSVIPCERGPKCSWPACAADCDGRPGRTLPREIQWLTTEPNSRSPATGHDAGQRSWRLHAVIADGRTQFASIRGRAALCGLVPRHGWGLDLFVSDRCARCCAKLNEGEH